jgi:ubiquinone/menaquinone biosynthesis C-methylase UbiE
MTNISLHKKIFRKVKKTLIPEKPNGFDTMVGILNEQARINWIKSKLLEIPKDLKILDAGAGELTYKKYCDHLVYVSQDFAQYDGKGDSKGLQTKDWDHKKLDIISDITSIPEPNHSFDAILCSEVLEHLPNPILALNEFNRLIKKNGYLIITAPFCSLTHFSPYHYSTGFNRYFYEHHLKQLGFKIIEITQNGNYFDFIAQELRRLSYVAEEYSHQKLKKKQMQAISSVLLTLNELSEKDTTSKDLLTFGYHVLARKV